MAKRVRLPKAERELFWRRQINDWAQGGQTLVLSRTRTYRVGVPSLETPAGPKDKSSAYWPEEIPFFRARTCHDLHCRNADLGTEAGSERRYALHRVGHSKTVVSCIRPRNHALPASSKTVGC
jgi:hypothetical protein